MRNSKDIFLSLLKQGKRDYRIFCEKHAATESASTYNIRRSGHGRGTAEQGIEEADLMMLLGDPPLWFPASPSSRWINTASSEFHS